MNAPLYNIDGKEVGSVALPEDVFGAPWNADLVHQVITSMETNARAVTAHAKTRAEVRGGGKKPWKQKGTGRARHGSTRSPIWVGGGVAHGPRNEKNFARKVSKKMKAKALYTILSRKMKDGEVLFVDTLSLKVPKTKEAKAILDKIAGIKGFEKLGSKRKNAFFIGLPARDEAILKSFRNFNNGMVDELRNISPLSALNYTYVVVVNPETALQSITGKTGNKVAAPKEAAPKKETKAKTEKAPKARAKKAVAA
jgi:large subunit ribosomal protein L4